MSCQTREPNYKYIILGNSSYIVGYRVLSYSTDGFLSCPYTAYKYAKSKSIVINNLGINISEPPKKHNSLFLEPFIFTNIENPDLNYIATVDKKLLTKNGRLKTDKDAKIYHGIIAIIVLPVIFKENDIVICCDKNYVSVVKFTIPNIKIMEKIIKEIYEKNKQSKYVEYRIRKVIRNKYTKDYDMITQAVSYYEWLKAYKNFYNYLTKKIRQLKKNELPNKFTTNMLNK